jgi:hypothetical protein
VETLIIPLKIYFRLAIDLYTRAMEKEGSNPQYLLARAQAFIKMGAYKEARRDSEEAIRYTTSSARFF